MEKDHPLRRWRLNHKPAPLNQADLGELLGVGASQISQIENGQKGCSLDIALKIARLAGDAVPLESLLPRQPESAA